MNSPKGRERIEAFCATTAGNIGISATKLKTISLPVPSLIEQEEIVKKMHELFGLVKELQQLQTATQTELDALLPAILDKAFKGEL